MSSGRAAALPAALRIWPVISSRPALEIGCGVSASGSKKIGSSGPGSRPNFARNFRSCSWIARGASAFSGIVFGWPFLRSLKYAIFLRLSLFPLFICWHDACWIRSDGLAYRSRCTLGAFHARVSSLSQLNFDITSQIVQLNSQLNRPGIAVLMPSYGCKSL
jgi:hypothetical protein